MPELPEVEVARANLSRWAMGRTIVDVEAQETRVLRPGRAADLGVLAGTRLREVARTGKALLWWLDDDGSRQGERAALGVYAHLGMTGKWVRRAAGQPMRHSQIRLLLDDASVLHYVDPRMFGRFLLVPAARFEDVRELRGLGPDPLRDGIDTRRLAERLAGTRRAVKVALLDQSLLAGVGNIQASEALWRARIDPRRAAGQLSERELGRLAVGVLESVRDTLEAFRRDGALSGSGDVAYVEEGGHNPFVVYGREGERCPRGAHGERDGRGGAGTIARIVQAGRSTFFCPRCQTARAHGRG